MKNFFIFCSIFSFVMTKSVPSTETRNFKIYPNHRNEDFDFWMKTGQDEIEIALNRIKKNFGSGEEDILSKLRRPKNLVIFVGDGLGIATVTAARIFKGQQKFGQSGEETKLIWEEFPEVALLKTYNVDSQTPDSAGTATALFSGVKTNYKTLGFDSSVTFRSPPSQLEARKVTTLLDWAQEAGKKTGIVTTSRLTHATPAALYAHSASRDWECDTFMKKERGHVLDHEDDPDPEVVWDIARQLIHNSPGNRTNVLLGGGLFALTGQTSSKWTCGRSDGRDLIQDWISEKEEISPNRSLVVRDKDGLHQIDPKTTDYLLGVFAPTHLSYEDQRATTTHPSLSEMARKAVDILKQGNQGFFLMVEGARIDHAHHDGFANRALMETLGFEEALESVINSLEETNQLDETLIIVTADHSHTLTILGHPKRGTDIRGLTGNLASDGYPEPILSYANGPGYVQPSPSENCSSRNLSEVDMFSFDFKPPARIPAGIESHGGEDVGLWATGPMSFMFHKTHEQSYVAHASSYALCIGPYKNHPSCQQLLNIASKGQKASPNFFATLSFLSLLTFIFL